jgi:precorrin-6A synthase
VAERGAAPAVRIIGFGCHPDHLTPEARAALASCDYVVAAAKSDDDRLLAVRAALCRQVGVELVAVPDPARDRTGPDGHGPRDYDGAVRDWHDARAEAWGAVLAERGGVAGFLVWGDPAFYDSTIRVVDRLGLSYDVVPGISAPQLLAARHRVVLHEVGRPVLFTTGRRLLADAVGHDNLVVMLDGSLTCRRLSGEWDIWWGANLGTSSERLVSGPLAAVLPEIESARAAAKADAGWVMDTYLVRRAS